jgi:hypothetical protein
VPRPLASENFYSDDNSRITLGKKNTSFHCALFHAKCRTFTKTGSGQTLGKLKKRGRFLAGAIAAVNLLGSSDHDVDILSLVFALLRTTGTGSRLLDCY